MRLVAVLVLVACTTCAQNPFFGPFESKIVAYLSLGDEQFLNIVRQNDDYADSISPQQRLIVVVQQEIAEETAKSPLDPSAIGIRYAELEAIRRQIADRGKQTVTDNNALLTEPQRVKLKDLEEAVRLIPIGSAAQVVYLLPILETPGSMIIGTILAPAPGSMPVIRFPVGAGEQVRAHLSLTEDQMQRLIRQNEDYFRWLAIKQERMFAVQSEIAVETAKSPLAPSALGLRYVELEVIRREVADRVGQLIVENSAMLTGAQLARLKILEGAVRLEQTGSEAISLRLLPEIPTGIFYAPNPLP